MPRKDTVHHSSPQFTTVHTVQSLGTSGNGMQHAALAWHGGRIQCTPAYGTGTPALTGSLLQEAKLNFESGGPAQAGKHFGSWTGIQSQLRLYPVEQAQVEL